MTDVAIVGWAHSPFGKLEAADLESLIEQVAHGAIVDAGLDDHDIDGVFVGVFNSGFSRQSFASSLPMNSAPGLRFKPAVGIENACATGSAAIHAAKDFIAAGRGRFALVVGAEKMTHVTSGQAGDFLLGASYQREEGDLPGGFAGVFGRMAETYFQRHGDQSDALAAIAAKNHRNGVDNPYAQMRRDFGFEFCRHPSEKNPFVAGPLKRTDCSLISDGAAALVLADADTAASLRRAVRIKAAIQVNDFLPLSRRDAITFEAGALAWSKAFEASGRSLGDLSFVETHDCFTIAELIEYEAMGLTEAGQGARAVLEGWTQADGRLPVNRSGGLKAKGHPIGATGVSMHVLSAMQLCGEAGAMQLPRADVAGVFNMGGTAVANYVSVLERLD
ncbi:MULTISPECIES: acetyl-CoA acetyltransferase [unclassified Brevundimonas]|uniref:acetyl-CoA acetyltransferase n=1 Tax=unclassified Brevundimonas TaxID=2622653 RepID=UPI000CFC31B2|nr:MULTISPECIES: acetyl-CoA acetyltransferase [unclassified Brevundimonas]PRA27413.1 acetyl-CoA acetyltransferase [Brevundimonas sp. MYb27]PQZ84580.1 acetyl-CoA acetyltransferase [Brevundimonas sp. MYb31]PRB17782.1 acetyl-CoA acetyltransferase [Brevundimonas sp. MYb52]PRB38340.1 acetyl-CoA acetyltransferase [Brevundimonas sp. MYb46]PRB56065.1 acetyl-CoA acetyltransferase [Brevundimonas sp. MYb33]